MSGIDLKNYATVDERITLFYRAHPEGRIITTLTAMDGEIGKTRWIVTAEIYRDSDRDRPDSTGIAFEIDGAGMAQRSAALETCETSAIGRALANLGFTGNRGRASREEMRKALIAEVREQARRAKSRDDLNRIYEHAQSQGVLTDVKADLFAANDRLGEVRADGAVESGGGGNTDS